MMFKDLITVVFFALIASVGVAHAQHDHNHDHGHSHGHSHDHAHDATSDHHGHDHSGHNHSGHNHSGHDHAAAGHGDHGCAMHHHGPFDVAETAMHHIGDANVYSIGPLQIPLPVILYAPDHGLKTMMSSAFKPELLGHGNGHVAVDGYVLHGGTIKRVADKSFPMGEVEVKGFRHGHTIKEGKEVEASYVCTGEQEYILDAKSTADAGLFGGGITSFYDFSLTKNVVTMLLVCFFLFMMFRSVAKAYGKRDGEAPSGLQSLMETVIVFLRDEVAIPFIGYKWERYFGFLMSVFFFILGLNLFGQVPFFGGSNVTGNLGVTMVLAIIAFLVTNLSGNSHYWSHLFLAPGVPWFVKIILIPVEIMGMFIKPLTLMLRLFANITAGHIVMIVFVGLIFIFGKSGESVGGALGASVGSTLLTMFMMAIELIVAFVQAFVFTILTASYIGAATEEAHH